MQRQILVFQNYFKKLKSSSSKTVHPTKLQNLLFPKNRSRCVTYICIISSHVDSKNCTRKIQRKTALSQNESSL